MLTKARRRFIYKKIANYLTPCSANIPQAGDPQWERKNWWLRKAGLKIGKSVIISHDFHCLTDLEENIQIDDYSVLGEGVRFWNFNLISIGSFTLIAADVTFVNGGHDTNNFVPFSGHLTIGRGCWIGNGARIVGELSIGDHVIIGAGSVVIRDIPNCSIVAGVPARVIGERTVSEYVWRTGTRNTFFNSSTFEPVVIENSEDIVNQNKFLRDTYHERLFLLKNLNNIEKQHIQTILELENEIKILNHQVGFSKDAVQPSRDIPFISEKVLTSNHEINAASLILKLESFDLKFYFDDLNSIIKQNDILQNACKELLNAINLLHELGSQRQNIINLLSKIPDKTNN